MKSTFTNSLLSTLISVTALCLGLFLFVMPAPEAAALAPNMADTLVFALSGLLLFCIFIFIKKILRMKQFYQYSLQAKYARALQLMGRGFAVLGLLLTLSGSSALTAQIASDGISSTTSSNGAATITLNHTTGAGSNRLMLVGTSIEQDGAVPAVVNSVTYGTGMTALQWLRLRSNPFAQPSHLAVASQSLRTNKPCFFKIQITILDMKKLYALFELLSIVLSCLALFGLYIYARPSFKKTMQKLQRVYLTDVGHKLSFLLPALLLLPFLSGAQVLNLSKSANVMTAPSGTTVNFTVNLGCSSLLNDCLGAVLTDVLPAGVMPVPGSLVPVLIQSGVDMNFYPITPVYNNVLNTLTWDFTTLPEMGLPDGTSTMITYSIAIPPGVIPGGSSLTNMADLTGTNSPPASANATVTVTAIPKWTVAKALQTSPIYHDDNETYRITIAPNGASGNLNLSNVTVTDMLPPGAVFVSVSANSGTQVFSLPVNAGEYFYDAGNNTVTWGLGNLLVTGSNITRDVTVTYPVTDALNNDTGMGPVPKTNDVDFVGTPVGLPEQTLTASTTNNLLPPVFATTFVKQPQDNRILPLNELNYFRLSPANTSTVAVNDFFISDPIPVQFDLELVRLSGFTPTSEIVDEIRVQLNGVPTWITWQTAVPLSSTMTFDVSTIPGWVPGTSYVSLIEFRFNTVPRNFAGNIDLGVQASYPLANDGTATAFNTPYSNTATLTAINPLNGSVIGPVSATGEMCFLDRIARIAPLKDQAINYVTPPPGSVTAGNPYFPGSRVRYTLTLENDGTDGNETGSPSLLTGVNSFIPLVDPIMSDLLPADMTYEAGSYEIINNTTGLVLDNTGTNPTFEVLSNFNGTGRTLLRWRFTGSVPVGGSLQIRLNSFIKMTAIPGNTLTNDYCLSSTTNFICDSEDCGTTNTSVADFFNETSGGIPITGITEMCCRSISLTVRDTSATLLPEKIITSTGPYFPTGSPQVESGLYKDTVAFTLKFENHINANYALPNPIAMDLLPSQLDYAAGSFVLTNNTTGLTLDDTGGNPTFEVIPNYAGTGRTLLRWKFTGNFPINTSVELKIKTIIRPGSGGSFTNTTQMTTNDRSYDCQNPSTVEVDVNDLDGDGNVVEQLCGRGTPIPVSITSLASMSSTKFVKGANDSTFLRLPFIASTNLDDAVAWKLLISNPGNVTLTNPVVIDIFPYINDVGVQLNDTNNPGHYRGTAWRPYVIMPIVAPPTIQLYYSQSTNPCRPEISPVVSAGCVNDWSVTAPGDLSTIRAIKIEVLNPLLPADSIVLDILMRAPASGVVPGSIAWNSLARSADQIPDQEPNKVGVRLDVFDLALTKTKANSDPVYPGGSVTFNIKVINQGSITADSIKISDYFPASLALNDGNWMAAPPIGAIKVAMRTLTAGNELPVGGLKQNEEVTIPITFILDPALDTRLIRKLVNYAEISASDDATGSPRLDGDGTFDGDPSNDAGGQPGSPADNWINGDGSGAAGNGVQATDEDNSDPAEMNVAYMDLALIKTLATGQITPVTPTQNVTYTVTVINQGTIAAGNINVSDYFLVADMDFVGVTSGSLVTVKGNSAVVTDLGAGNISINTLATGDSLRYDVTLNVKFGFSGTSLINRAEISSNTGGVDIDSSPDNLPGNDPGGQPDSPADNTVQGDGTGVPGDGNPATDEDDADPASIQVISMSLGSTVFVDPNNNGIQDPSELGIPNVTLELYTNAGVFLTSTMTDANGNYLFNALPPGTFYVQIPGGQFGSGQSLFGYPSSSTPTDTNDNQQDSDDNGIQAGGYGTVVRSPDIVLSIGTETTSEPGQGGDQDAANDNNGDMTVDFGFVPLLSIGSSVFVDNNNNGIDDGAGDAGINGVLMELWSTGPDGIIGGGDDVQIITGADGLLGTADDGAAGPVVTANVSGNDGTYFFGNLLPGNFYVRIPGGTNFSGPLSNTPLSSTNIATSPTDNNVDNDDNGNQTGGIGTIVTSPVINLFPDAEAIGEPGPGGAQDDADDNNGNMTVDFGFVIPVSIGSTVFYDRNDDGIQAGALEVGIAGVASSIAVRCEW